MMTISDKYVSKERNDFDYMVQDGGTSLTKVYIGGHGTALSTIINYYDPSFGYDDFEKMKYKMPWIVEMHFDDEGSCDAIYTHDLD